jgi:hypothetical protein
MPSAQRTDFLSGSPVTMSGLAMFKDGVDGYTARLSLDLGLNHQPVIVSLGQHNRCETKDYG